MQDEPDAANLRRDLFQCLQPLASDCIFQNGETREVSAGLRHVRNVTTAERIADDHEYNWYGACFLLQNRRYLIRTRYNHVRVHSDQLSGEGPRHVGVAAGPTNVEADIAALHPTQILKAALKGCDAGLSFIITFGVWHQHSDAPHGLALLRACSERPRCRRSAEKRYELAPPHSITSSAATRRVCGTV